MQTIETLSPKVVGNEEGRVFPAPGTRLQQKLTSHDTGGQYSFHASEIQPGFGPPMHIHTLEDELFYVLEGQVEFTVGEETFLATAGTTVFAPRGIQHKFKGVGDTASKMLGMSLGSNFERFYEKLSAAVSAPSPDIHTIQMATAEHGIVLVRE